MKTSARTVGVILACGWAGWAAALPAPAESAAIQAMAQAPDPSAAVAAYANGIGGERDNPEFYQAYIARMVELGAPELAYHQAQTLTTMQTNNGLAWAVVAYAEGRRGRMNEAVSAINLAGQFAPDNKFVAHTAGELMAWYDNRADTVKLPDSAKGGLAKTRSLLGKQTAFTEAYDAASKAYQSLARPASPSSPIAQAPVAPVQVAPDQVVPGQSAPLASVPVAPEAPPGAPVVLAAPGPVLSEPIAPLSYAAPPPIYYPDYYGSFNGPDYYYDWGPGWLAPAPYWWWHPFGFWGGYGFLPFGSVWLFGDFDGHRHFRRGRDFDRGDRFGRGGHFDHNGSFGAAGGVAVWRRDPQGRDSYLGTPARPVSGMVPPTGLGTEGRSTATGPGLRSPWGTGDGRRGFASAATPTVGPPPPSALEGLRSLHAFSGSVVPVGSTLPVQPNLAARPGVGVRPTSPGAFGSLGNLHALSGPAAPAGSSLSGQRSVGALSSQGARSLPTSVSGNLATLHAFSSAPTFQYHAAASRGGWNVPVSGASRGGLIPHAAATVPSVALSRSAPAYQAAITPRGGAQLSAYRAPSYSTPYRAAPSSGAYGAYRQSSSYSGAWRPSAPTAAAPGFYSGGRTYSAGAVGSHSLGSYGGYRGGSVSGGYHGGSSFSSGSHGGGGFSGGSHGGGSSGHR